MAQPNSYPKPKWSIFDMQQLRLNGAPWDPKNFKQAPNVAMFIVNGNPRFRLYLNNGGKNTALSFKINPYVAATIFEMVEEISKDPAVAYATVQVKGNYHNSPQRLEKPIVTGTVTVGRNSEGLMYVAFQAKGEAMATFPFKPHWLHPVMADQGEPMEPGKLSNILARAWAKTMRGLMFAYYGAADKYDIVDKNKEEQYAANGNNFNSGNSAPTPAGATDMHSDYNDADVW